MDNYVRVEKKTERHFRSDSKNKTGKSLSDKGNRSRPGSETSDVTFDNLEDVSIGDIKNWEKLPDDLLEDILRVKWDLDPKFGPFLGIDRMQRWKRAERYELHPPEVVRDIILSGRVKSGGVTSGYF